MNSNIDRLHLKRVGLAIPELRLLGLLMQTGGEYPMPETPQGRALVEVVRAKNLVTIVARFGERDHVRLTDEGRVVLAQLEAMAAQPKVEVESTYELPPNAEAKGT